MWSKDRDSVVVVAIFSVWIYAVISLSYDCDIPTKGHKSVFVVTGRKATYKCQPDYEYEKGDSERFCLKNGSWSGIAMSCRDAINCKEDNYPCMNGGICIDTDPSLFCRCSNTGFYGSLCEEADGNWGNWLSWGNCTSTCNAGVLLRRRQCDNPRPTKRGLMCEGESLQVEYCYPGLCADGMYNWCGEETDRCGQQSGRAFCSIRENTYRCTCLNGVEEIRDENGFFVRCGDLNECTLGVDNCDPTRAICINTVGSFECRCKPGYTGNGQHCTDINECRLKTHNCDVNAKCYNKPAGYNCKCRRGFRSISVNGTGFVGECKESRLLLFGNAAGDYEITTKSKATGEVVTPLIGAPPGIALQGKYGNDFSCNSVYASENGVIVITRLAPAADSDRKPTFRNPKRFVGGKAKNSKVNSFDPYYKFICGIIAPFWADAKFSARSHMWMHVYNDSTWPGITNTSRAFRSMGFAKISDLLPFEFNPNFAVVFTWENMAPPWPTLEGQEEVTFQSIIMSDGSSTYVINLYEDGAMTWRPVYDIPKDIPYFPAISGYIVKGQSGEPYVLENSASGTFHENQDNIYRLDQLPFNSTFLYGRDLFELTPSVNVGSKSFCYDWFSSEEMVSKEALEEVHRCPSNLDALSDLIDKVWIESRRQNGNYICYTWIFILQFGEAVECCYRTDGKYQPPPILSGLHGWDKGAGFMKANETEDEQLREICCGESKRLYYCELYARRRPPTSDRKYIKPKMAKYNESGYMVSFNGTESLLNDIGDFQILSLDIPQNSIEIIARFKLGSSGEIELQAFGLQDNNGTIQMFMNDDEFSCLYNSEPCNENFNYDPNIVIGQSNNGSAFYATRYGIFAEVVKTVNNKLEFLISIPEELLASVDKVSGLISDSKHCYVIQDDEFSKVSCRLEDIAAANNISYSSQSFFTDEVESIDYTKRPISSHSGILMKGLNPQQSNPEKEEVGEKQDEGIMEIVDADVTVKAKPLTDESKFLLTVNVSNYEGDVTINDEKVDREEDGSIQFKINDNVPLNSSVTIGLTGTGNKKTKLIFQKIVICDCDDKHGDCDAIEVLSEDDGLLYGACICDDGFTGVKCDEEEKPCKESPCFIGVSCNENKNAQDARTELDRRYTCDDCPPVLELGNGETCYHANQCLVPRSDPDTHKCKNATCINLPQNYECQCFTGYQRQHNDDEYTCSDIDECRSGKLCDPENGICINTPGSYECSCVQGYSIRDSTVKCHDLDECLIDNGGCKRSCRNTVGSFECTCELGFVLGADRRTCIEINECEQFADSVCSQICEDFVPGHTFVCRCHNNYVLQPDYRTCVANFTTAQTTTDDFTTEPTTSFKTTTEKLVETTKRLTTNPTTEMETTQDYTTGDSFRFPFDWEAFPVNRAEKIRNAVYRQYASDEEFESLKNVENQMIEEISSVLGKVLSHQPVAGAVEHTLNLHKVGLSVNPNQECLELHEFFISDAQGLEEWKNFDVHIRKMNRIVFLAERFPNLNEYSFTWDTVLRIYKKKMLYIMPGRSKSNIDTSHKPRFEIAGIAMEPTSIAEISDVFLEMIECYNDILMLNKMIKVTTNVLTTTSQTRKERRAAELTLPVTRNNKSILAPNPVLFYGIIVGACFGGVGVFVVLVVGTYYCFTWTKHRQLQKESIKLRKKKLAAKQWPQVVITQDPEILQKTKLPKTFYVDEY